MTGLPKPKAVLFDWDDTLVDNWHTAYTALNTALVHMGTEPWSEDEARRRSGPSARDLFTSLFGAERWEEADKVYYDTFYKLVTQNARLHDDVEDLLKGLTGHGIFLAVVSNKRGSLLRRESDHLGFNAYFKNLVGAGDAAKDKPDPAPVHMALAGSGIAAGPDVWFIGDSHTDMLCALNAGCTGVLIETKVPPADLLIKNPPAWRYKRHKELMELIGGYFV
jgi:phosphoglycolate phosphatase